MIEKRVLEEVIRELLSDKIIILSREIKNGGGISSRINLPLKFEGKNAVVIIFSENEDNTRNNPE